MGLFRRKGAPPAADTIPAFWAWWTAEGAQACATALADGSPDQIADEMSARVLAMHPGLAWELTPGEVSEHQLVVTAEGKAEVRPVARRWLLAAPAADSVWSYDDHRGAAQDPEGVVLSGSPGAPEVAFRDVTVSARMAGSRIDVVLHHPSFDDLDEGPQMQVAFLALDAALGENDTELWIGEIKPTTYPPMDGFGLVALRALVDNLRRKSLDADGRPQWALLQGQGPRGPVLAAARSPLHPLFGPLDTRHVAVSVAYRPRTEAGLPTPEALEDLRLLEDRLEAAAGSDGILVAHESSAGTRIFHLYVDPETDAADRIKASLGDWPGERPRLHVTDGDPGWELVRHLR